MTLKTKLNETTKKNSPFFLQELLSTTYQLLKAYKSVDTNLKNMTNELKVLKIKYEQSYNLAKEHLKLKHINETLYEENKSLENNLGNESTNF